MYLAAAILENATDSLGTALGGGGGSRRGQRGWAGRSSSDHEEPSREDLLQRVEELEQQLLTKDAQLQAYVDRVQEQMRREGLLNESINSLR